MNLERIILHIGRHKSGTSSLQKSLSSNADLLASAGILYPRYGRNGKIAHHAIAESLNPKTRQPKLDPEQIAKGISLERQRGEETIIISSEAFQNISELSLLKRLITILKPDQIMIICYFREYLDYAVSSYRQYIHANSQYVDFKKYIKRRFNSMECFINNWRQIGNLKIKWFDVQTLLGNDIVVDFLKTSEIDLQIPTQRMNPSIGGDLLFLKLLYNFKNRQLLDYNQLSEICSIRPEWSSPFRISDAVASELRDDSDYNHSLIKELGDVRHKSFAHYDSLPTGQINETLLQCLETNYNFSIKENLIKKIYAGKFSHLLDL